MGTEKRFSVANQEAGNTYQPIRRPETPACPTFASWRGQPALHKCASRRRATQSARATSGVSHTGHLKAPTRSTAETGAQAASSSAAFPGSHPVRTCAASTIPAVLGRQTPRELRLLRIRAANGARHVVVTSWEAYIASSRGEDARGAYVAATTHSDATRPRCF